MIEAVFEDRAIKAEATKKTQACGAELHCFAPIHRHCRLLGLSEASNDAKNFIGLHFFSPVDKMPLVEIIMGKDTGDEALAKAFDYVLQIKKTPIVVNDSRGFFTSRVFGTFCMEGVNMLAEGYNPLSIEQAALQAGMPIGPLAILDEVNLELTRKVRVQTEKDLAAEGKSLPFDAAAPHREDAQRVQASRQEGRQGLLRLSRGWQEANLAGSLRCLREA
jgi:3-hydroxyacyl-CoA dehydrogenase/enoyl-CoA hydratase/3-hydroxybutyryl-CoA epimerase